MILVAFIAGFVTLASYLVMNISKIQPSQALQTASQGSSLSMTLGGLVLVFLAFNFAMLRVYSASPHLTKTYSLAAIGNFAAAALSLFDSILFVQMQLSSDSLHVIDAFIVLSIASVLFLVCAGYVVVQQIG